MPQLQPNSRSCFVCGMENPVGLKLRFYQTAPDEVTAEYIAPEHFEGYPGVLHGGIIAAILDEISGRALMGSDPQHPRFMFTAKLSIKYRRNVPVGKPLRLVGRVVRDRGRAAEAWGGIYDAQTGELLTEADALHIDVPKEQFDMSQLEALGWKVYPD